nr:uncharacterized protein LOC123574658 isoform X2 [Macaca fascicularis]XP_045253065.1 uncharacterized protein LOC123574658 isoform X2 [Macaca fascicularis]XP_045253066.1 uncharacterized protein LOC123574658 isoform X2 [Macaca fascicularis]XP_045253067.1 uncharacterized protein LOC123574658 isoform X2 [Macaca fascicularis]XP_045253068.1 uncharacterized protein LOC123574658 isoform X2 [Macaca fascicularis]XP_045253069.1 uncharacterized protein LOC123574658 isoform X2 [Macaca fascicularis]XP_04
MGHPPYAGNEHGQFFSATKAPKVLELVWLSIHGAPPAGGWLRTGQLPWEARRLLEGRWSILLSHKGPAESWSQCGLASWVHLVLVDCSGRDSCRGRSAACCQGRWSMLLSNIGPRGFRVAWHPLCTPCWRVAQDAAVCHERSTTCWQRRWSILLTNGGCLESLIWCGLASMVHPMLVDGSGWCSFHGRCGTCWKEDS